MLQPSDTKSGSAFALAGQNQNSAAAAPTVTTAFGISTIGGGGSGGFGGTLPPLGGYGSMPTASSTVGVGVSSFGAGSVFGQTSSSDAQSFGGGGSNSGGGGNGFLDVRPGMPLETIALQVDSLEADLPAATQMSTDSILMPPPQPRQPRHTHHQPISFGGSLFGSGIISSPFGNAVSLSSGGGGGGVAVARSSHLPSTDSKDSNHTGTQLHLNTSDHHEMPALPNTGWTLQWRIEYAMEAAELQAMRAILNSSASTKVLPSTPDCNPVALFKKVYAGCNAVSAHADRFYSQSQQAHTENAALKKLVAQRDAQLAEMNQRLRQMEMHAKGVEQQLMAIKFQAMNLGSNVTAPTTATNSNSNSNSNSNHANTSMAVVSSNADEQKMWGSVIPKIRDSLICPICHEIALLPKVLGTCGHIACQNCLKQLDDHAFQGLATNNSGMVSARQHLSARRCPQCRAEIIGAAFNVLALKEIAHILGEAGLLQSFGDGGSGSGGYKPQHYEQPTADARHISALQIGCYAQSQLAQHSVSGVLTIVTRIQWVIGVYIVFESAVSRVFFETFATTLHGKAGGLNVLVNTPQRMLAVQLVEKSNQKTDIPKGASHLLIKVATDGRFQVTNAPNPKAAASAAESIQVADARANATNTALASAAASQPITLNRLQSVPPPQITTNLSSGAGAAAGLSAPPTTMSGSGGGSGGSSGGNVSYSPNAGTLISNTPPPPPTNLGFTNAINNAVNAGAGGGGDRPRGKPRTEPPGMPSAAAAAMSRRQKPITK